MSEIEEIRKSLTVHNELSTILKKKGIYNAWINYKRLKWGDKIVQIDKEDFTRIEAKYHFVIPEDIRYFYEEIGAEKNDFHYQMNRLLNYEDQVISCFQYTEEFAVKLITEYNKLNDLGKSQVKEQITEFDTRQNRNGWASDLEYLLMEDDFFFDLKTKSFKIPFLQKIFDSLNNNTDLIIHVFITWIHCGGAGGIILNTERKGFNGGLMHGYGQEVVIDGITYTYNSNYYPKSENYHLLAFKNHILAELHEIKQFNL